MNNYTKKAIEKNNGFTFPKIEKALTGYGDHGREEYSSAIYAVCIMGIRIAKLYREDNGRPFDLPRWVMVNNDNRQVGPIHESYKSAKTYAIKYL